MPHPEGACRRQLRHRSPDGLESAEEREESEGGSEDETPHRRLERRLSGTSAVRNMTYGAIALPVGAVAYAEPESRDRQRPDELAGRGIPLAHDRVDAGRRELTPVGAEG